MGMSTRVIGLKSANGPIYKKHAAVLRACIDAGIKKLPEETAKYFGSEYPDNYLFEEVLEIDIPKHEYSEDMVEGYEVHISELPEEVEVIRFFNSY